MQEIIHADIFFFVTTVALIVIGILLLVAILYGISILNDVKYITRRIRHESEEVIQDLHLLRNHIKDEGLKWATVSAIFGRFFGRRKKGKKE